MVPKAFQGVKSFFPIVGVFLFADLILMSVPAIPLMAGYRNVMD